jgi:hypothetical protein
MYIQMYMAFSFISQVTHPYLCSSGSNWRLVVQHNSSMWWSIWNNHTYHWWDINLYANCNSSSLLVIGLSCSVYSGRTVIVHLPRLVLAPAAVVSLIGTDRVRTDRTRARRMCTTFRSKLRTLLTRKVYLSSIFEFTCTHVGLHEITCNYA